jgi:phosphatidylglycerol:prolipoprotein diacylglycerol transferase
MFVYPQINPVALDLGVVQIHWYAIMYLLGFLVAWMLGRWRARQVGSHWTARQVDDLIFFAAIGVIVGGRIGYMLFYDWLSLTHDPLSLLKIWQGGMSFHGGLLGVGVALIIFARRRHKYFLEVTDFIAPLTPLGLGFGRIGNFINGELWGRVTDVPWAMVFPYVDALPRHPSMLYEALLEGGVLFGLVWWFSAKPKPRGAVTGLFLSGYGLIRFLVEFVREPDSHLGFLFGWVTMGQLLSLPMIIAGVILLVWAYQRGGQCGNT